MKTIQTLMIIVGGAVSVLGQGQVDFRNGGVTFPTVADRRVYLGPIGSSGGGGCGPLVGTNYVAALFYAPGANVNFDSLTSGTQAGALATFRQPTTAQPGTWLNPVPVGNYRVLDGVDVGQTATLQIRVWDITKYATYLDAFAAGGMHIRSVPFNYTVPPAVARPDAYYMDNLRAFASLECPEPSAPVLLALGAFTWLWLRKKRQGTNKAA